MVEPNPSTTTWPSQWPASSSGCQPCQTAFAVMGQALELARLALVILQAKMAEDARMRETGSRHQHRDGHQSWQGEQAAGAAAGEAPPTPTIPASSGPKTGKPSVDWRKIAGHVKDALALIAAFQKAWPAFTWAWRLYLASWAGKHIARWLGLL